MDALQTANSDLKALKGWGRVRVVAPGDQRIYERAVWVGAEPGRLRFAFLAPTGPVFPMSCDETWVTALRHADGEYYRRQIGDNSLSGLLPVQIKCADLFGLLVGRLPGVAYDAVRLDTDEGDGNGDIVMLLQRRFRGTVGRIRADRDSGELTSVELLDIHGNRLYEARLEGMQTIAGYRLPSRIRLSGPDGGLELEIARIEPDADVAENVFRIMPPGAD
jgi:hypothetical protein